MASSTVEPMPQTIDGYKKLAQKDLELIMEMKAIISKQNEEIHKLKKQIVKQNIKTQKLVRMASKGSE